MIKNVIFDLDGVIRGYKNIKIKKLLPKEKRKEYHQYLNKRIREVFAEYKKMQVFEDFDLKKVTRAQLLEKVYEVATDPKEVLYLAYNYPFVFKNNFLYKKVIKLAKKLKKQGYKLYILSNMNQDIVSFVPNLLDVTLFDDIIFSCDIGLVKPNKEIYEFVINKWGIIPKESIFIDDKAINLKAFENLGGHVFCFDYNQESRSIRKLTKMIKSA